MRSFQLLLTAAVALGVGVSAHAQYRDYQYGGGKRGGLSVRGELITGLGASVRHFRTEQAHACPVFRTPQHEVSCRLADLRAVEQQPEVVGVSKIAAPLAAIDDRLDAVLVAIGARLNAASDLFARLRKRRTSHHAPGVAV